VRQHRKKIKLLLRVLGCSYDRKIVELLQDEFLSSLFRKQKITDAWGLFLSFVESRESPLVSMVSNELFPASRFTIGHRRLLPNKPGLPQILSNDLLVKHREEILEEIRLFSEDHQW